MIEAYAFLVHLPEWVPSHRLLSLLVSLLCLGIYRLRPRFLFLVLALVLPAVQLRLWSGWMPLLSSPDPLWVALTEWLCLAYTLGLLIRCTPLLRRPAAAGLTSVDVTRLQALARALAYCGCRWLVPWGWQHSPTLVWAYIAICVGGMLEVLYQAVVPVTADLQQSK